MQNINIYWIDLFCGAGGTSSGIHFSDTNSFVLACVNHDANAIKSHKKNHPKTHHFTEDVRNFEVVIKIKKLVDRLRKKEPNCIINLWASLECTNFSKAKGGQSRDADSRTLAEHMFMYLDQLQPDYFYVENVREFMCWGPLCENGKPLSRTEGKDYVKWLNKVCSLGYKYDAKILNSANYGAYQSRERLFIQFSKEINPGIDRQTLPIEWPEQTHTKDKIESPLFPMKKWKAVKEILDLKDEGVSIFNRKKELSENTLKRIYAGLLKFVANGEEVFTKRYNGGKINPEQKVNSLNKPMGTICTNGTHALVKSVFIKKYYSGRPEGKVISVNGPAGTVKTVDGQAIVTASHLSTYYGNFGLHSIEAPSPTVTTKDRITKVNFIFNPAWGGNFGDIENPCCTVVARQDKAPLYLVSTQEGKMVVPVYDTDSETMVKIKEFMVLFGIIDIKMRMLKIEELKQIQGFPKDYKLVGTKTEQKKFIGNAVEVNQAKAIITSNFNSVKTFYKQLAS